MREKTSEKSKQKNIRKLFSFKNKKITPASKRFIIGGLILVAFLVIYFVIKFWSFSHYKVEISDTKENTLVYYYYTVDDKILKCASDTASFTDQKNETIWTITYEMSDPRVDICDNNIVIYDKNGTGVILCDETGKKNSFNAQLPIIKADIAKQGTVAILEDDGTTARIDYYDSDGSIISTIKTTLASDGYPMDIALSENGVLLAVSYINYNQGMAVTDVDFYSFGAAGQMMTDNIVSSFQYENTIIPQLEFMGSENCVAFGTDKVIVYEGGKAPQEKNIIEIDDEIRSTAVGEDSFAVVLTGNDNKGYEISVYNKKGKQRSTINTDFSYTSINIEDKLIVMYNRNEMCIYSTEGIYKFRGQFEFFIREIRFIDANRYSLAATDSYNIIRLY